MVTKAAVPSARRKVCPRALVMVTDRPSRPTRCGGAQRHDRHRLHDGALDIEPDLAALDFVGVRALVQTPLAAHLMLEVLHRVGHEDLAARDSRILERLVENAAGGADERLAAQVFLVAGLLADQHDARALASFTRHRLGGVLVQWTT